MFRNSRRQILGPSRAAKKRRRSFLAKASLVAVGLFMLAAYLSWLSYSDKVRIDKVYVTGVETINAGEIEDGIWKKLDGKIWRIILRNNSLLVNTTDLENFFLAEYPKIYAINVKRKDLKTLKVQIVERRPFALWCDGRSVGDSEYFDADLCYHIDSEGYMFAKGIFDSALFQLYGAPLASEISAQKASSTTERINWVGYYFMEPQTFARSVAFAADMQSRQINTYGIKVGSENFFELLLDDGGVIRFDPNSDLIALAKDIALSYEKKIMSDEPSNEIEYIDARFPNKILFKFLE